LSLGTSVDQPSPKCCSRTTLTLTPTPVNGSIVPCLARPDWARLARVQGFLRAKQNAPDSIRVSGRLLISPPPSAAQEQSNSDRKSGKWLGRAICGFNGLPLVCGSEAQKKTPATARTNQR